MKSLIKIAVLYAAYKIYTSLSTANKLSFKFYGIDTGSINTTQSTINLKARIFNPYEKITFNSFLANVLFNGVKIGIIDYTGNDIINKGYTDIIIPLKLTSFDTLVQLPGIIAQEGINSFDIIGVVTIDGIKIDYQNNIYNA